MFDTPKCQTDAVIFSTWLPTVDKSDYLRYWLEIITEGRFEDCDIYIGINPSSNQDLAVEICESFRECFKRMIIGIVRPDLAVNSDVSGYQKCMELMKEHSPKNGYRIVWFGHSRGMSHSAKTPLLYDGGSITKNFFNRREEITQKLNKNSGAGSWGPHMGINQLPIVEHFDSFFNFEYPTLQLAYLTTFFVFKGKPLNDFIQHCDHSFYNTNLKKHCPLGDRWLFEFVSGNIVWGQGYYPLFDHCHPLMAINALIPSEESVSKLIEYHQQKIRGIDALLKLEKEHPKLIVRFKESDLRVIIPIPPNQEYVTLPLSNEIEE